MKTFCKKPNKKTYQIHVQHHTMMH